MFPATSFAYTIMLCVLIEFRMKREEEPLEKIEAKENAAHTLTHKLWDSKKSSARAKGILVNYSR